MYYVYYNVCTVCVYSVRDVKSLVTSKDTIALTALEKTRAQK